MQIVYIIAAVITFICAIKIWWIKVETPDKTFYDYDPKDIDNSI